MVRTSILHRNRNEFYQSSLVIHALNHSRTFLAQYSSNKQCVAASLENFVSSLLTFRDDNKLNFRRLVFSTAPISLLYLIGIPLAADIPNLPGVCSIVDTTINVKSSVEQRFCTLRNGGLIVAGVAS